MAYSRFWDSDIYIYPHIEGHVECCACMLLNRKSLHITNDQDLIAHINEHRQAGHAVPDGLQEQILADPERYGAGND